MKHYVQIGVELYTYTFFFPYIYSHDIWCYINDCEGTEKIKSISLHLCHLEKDVKVSPAAFSKMSNLQYFQIICHWSAKFRLLFDHGHGLEFYPSNKHRYICWECYPYKSFPSVRNLENLVELNLTYSKLVEFWNENQVYMLLFWITFLGIRLHRKLSF